MTAYQIEKGLSDHLKAGPLSTGGMRVTLCRVTARPDIRNIQVSLVLNPAGLPAEHVEERLSQAIESVYVKAIVEEWSDVNTDFSSPSVVRITLDGTLAVQGGTNAQPQEQHTP